MPKHPTTPLDIILCKQTSVQLPAVYSIFKSAEDDYTLNVRLEQFNLTKPHHLRLQ